MSEGVSWLQAEGDFVKKMNDHYKESKHQHNILKKLKLVKIAFVMYDADTDETTSEANLTFQGCLALKGLNIHMGCPR